MVHPINPSQPSGYREIVFNYHPLTSIVLKFLNPQDFNQFRLTNKQINASVSKYLCPVETLEKQVGDFSEATTVGEFNHVFASFVTSLPFFQVSPERRAKTFQYFWDHLSLSNPNLSIEEWISHFDLFVDAIKRSPQKPTAVQIQQLCRDIINADQKKTFAWIIYRALEKFSPFAEDTVANELKRLFHLADLHVYHNSYNVQNSTIKFIEITVDPRNWFGINDNPFSLWRNNEQDDESAPLPALVQQVLWERISQIHQDFPNTPIEVKLNGRVEAELPDNFTLALTEQIIAQQIFVSTNGADTSHLNPFYTRLIGNLRNAELLALPQPPD